MQIQVHSTLSGPLSGWTCMNVDPGDKVEAVTDEFLRLKNVGKPGNLVLYGNNGLALDPDDTVAESGLTDGEDVFLGTADNYRSLFTFEKRWWLFLSVSAILVGIGGLVWAPFTFFQRVPIPFDYGVVIDAGSSGSRVALYQWAGDQRNGTGVVSQKLYCPIKNGGLTGVNVSVVAVSEYFEPCMNEIRKKLPQKERFSTPIYLGATAGMRLLQMVKPERSELLMEATRISLSSSGLSLQRCEIITGHEEGIDGWITVNFLQEILYDDDVDIPGKFPPKRKTYGAMDMGGASTQITFEVTEGTPIADPKDEANLRLFGHSYRIFSRSFTCFGINESHRRYLALLYAKSTPGVAISDPCGNAGRVSNVSVSWLFDSPCTQGLQSTTLAETSETVPIVGAWNETECSATIDELLSAEECNKYSNFCFNSSTVPPRIEGTSFIAFSIFYYAASELGLPSSVSEETFYEAALELCSRTYQTMSDLYAGKAGEKIEHVFCFEAFLIYKILRDNYGMSGEEFKLIEFRRKLPTPNGTDVGWALGFMINATNALPEDKPGPPMSSTLFSFLVFLFVGLSTCGSFMAYHSWILCRRRRVYAEYQRLNEPGVRNA